jgi:hypothetical protein
MSTQSDDDAWMAADDYGRSLRGLTVNLLVCDLPRVRSFHLQVLAAEELYFDSDFAAYRFQGAEWMLHADHTYAAHPLHPMLKPMAPAGLAPSCACTGAIQMTPCESRLHWGTRCCRRQVTSHTVPARLL